MFIRMRLSIKLKKNDRCRYGRYFRAQFFISDELPMLVNQRVAMLSPQSIRGELFLHIG